MPTIAKIAKNIRFRKVTFEMLGIALIKLYIEILSPSFLFIILIGLSTLKSLITLRNLS